MFLNSCAKAATSLLIITYLSITSPHGLLSQANGEWWWEDSCNLNHMARKQKEDCLCLKYQSAVNHTLCSTLGWMGYKIRQIESCLQIIGSIELWQHLPTNYVNLFLIFWLSSTPDKRPNLLPVIVTILTMSILNFTLLQHAFIHILILHSLPPSTSYSLPSLPHPL